jgi:hypothetical protein
VARPRIEPIRHPNLALVYHGERAFDDFVRFINRAKDELVSTSNFDAYVDEERRVFEARYGSYAELRAIVAELLEEAPAYVRVMPPRELKRRHFLSANVARSRTAEGAAIKRTS